ncbi:eclosion hormone-like [Tachypleus tridentatus]|uniref:eclosion hormone-like n=1 Tax=Tachypleus tridentatus TaxID=6853 RepID=UPI003FD3711C
MVTSSISLKTCLILLLICCYDNHMAEGFNRVSLCIKNCGQCKQIYGAHFEGKECAEACVQFGGTMMPDCNDFETISSFLNKLE